MGIVEPSMEYPLLISKITIKFGGEWIRKMLTLPCYIWQSLHISVFILKLEHKDEISKLVHSG